MEMLNDKEQSNQDAGQRALADFRRRGVKQSSLNLLKWPVLH
jgi:hypothetical protein